MLTRNLAAGVSQQRLGMVGIIRVTPGLPAQIVEEVLAPRPARSFTRRHTVQQDSSTDTIAVGGTVKPLRPRSSG